ncbi:gem-associated protein 8-like [Pararge aegeria]|uniref:Gem-associated protein 8 n=1 Tax=Pararge aegeria TaxID=116150 RepID=S4PTG3_9NEOP|nr:gem-associated protein 8-like [Pararge aegeria]
MTTWAENFTVAATWQLKHQLAYWKARAVSLQYENNVLHDVIRINHLEVPTTSKSAAVEESDCSSENSEHSDCEEEENDTNYIESESGNEEHKDEDVEVSEEFIQFLTANAKYKEDARLERERFKAKLEEESTPDLPESQESAEAKISRNKELYGDKYKRIIALEMYLMSDFQNELDKHKSAYWPNIPFNFNS